MSDTTDFDRQQVEKVIFPENLWYPKDKLPDDADAEYVYELFTNRNLLALSLLLQEIRKVRDEAIRNLLLYTFTSNLAFASIIIPVNEKRYKQGRNCTGVWGFKRFWIPSFHVENNVFKYFRNRLNRTIVAKSETNKFLRNTRANAKLINHSSIYMTELLSESVDFIFTDPPFGNMIPYLNLSTLWNAWLQFDAQAKDEIIIDQQHSEEDYHCKLTLVFKECHRVLKNDGFLVVTFNNKSMRVWRILLESIHNTCFSLQECLPAEDGEVSFTQTTKSAKGSLRGHFVYVFKKSEKIGGFRETDFDEAITKVEYELMNFINGTPKSITEIYNHVIPFMVNNSLLHSDFPDDIIEQILAKRGKQIMQKQNRVIEGEMVELKSYFWVPR
jgi:adenine-specific DNA methylase